jgi:CO/xanthine dehydrogenase Mo-binding subunit
VLVTSAIARGRISALDDRPARAMPGVLEVLSWRNVGDAVRPVGYALEKDDWANSTHRPLCGPEVRIEQRYSKPIQHHNPIKLSTTICVWEGSRLTVYEPTRYDVYSGPGDLFAVACPVEWASHMTRTGLIPVAMTK